METFYYKKNELFAESCNLNDLAKKYTTPLFVYSKNCILKNYQKFTSAFNDNDKHIVCYAVKANSNLSILNLLAKEGAAFDVVSIGELERVLIAGGNANMCIFSGVGKTKTEIIKAIELGVFCFNIESEAELIRINNIAKHKNKIVNIAIRINPNIDAKTHPYISTGLKENKFGINYDKVIEVYDKAKDFSHINIKGIATHIGSQITESKPFLDTLDKLLELAAILKNKGINIEHLDLGGGFGIKYDNEQTINIKNHIKAIAEKNNNKYQIIIEPGRAIVGNCGVLLTKVEYLKNTKEKSFAIVDAAMNDLIRPALYQSYHKVMPLVKNSKGIYKHWDIVGPICESADFLAHNRRLSLKQGDYLAIMSAGAYSFVMSSNYNSRTKAAEVLIDNDNHYLIRKREIIKDLVANEKEFLK